MIVNQFFKTENIIKVSPQDPLSKTLSLLSSSHDSAFVFEKDQFLGVVNPYYCLIKKSYPANTKVSHCLVHPPKVDINYSLKKVANLMINSKIHYLPVFAGERFLGIISARRLLFAIKDNEELKIPISEVLKGKKPLVSIYEDDFISKALSLFKQFRVSKLVVVSKDLKLRGILTYFDLIAYLSTPKEKQNFGAREGNKSSFFRKYVRNFMKDKVLTLKNNDSLSSAAKMILEKEIGSVVIIDDENHPIGIITTRDLLTVFASGIKKTRIKVIAKDLSQKSWLLVNQFGQWLNNQLRKENKLSAKILVKGKEGRGIFKTIVSFFSSGQIVKVVKKEGKNLKKILEEIKKKSR